MAFDDWEHDYHLTPSGWASGSFYVAGTLAKLLPVPIDSLLTLVQGNRNSKAQIGLKTTWKNEWKCPNCTIQQIDGLLTKFGNRPPKRA